VDTVYLDGKLVPSDAARVSVFDRGFMYGDGAFETVRVYGGSPFRAEAHWQRLEGSLARLGIPPPLDAGRLNEATRSVLDANGLSDAVLRVRVSRGVGPGGPGTAFDPTPTVVVTASGYKVHDEAMYSRGADVVVSRVRRVPDACLPSDAKSANYLNSILARRDAEAAGAYEAVMLNLEGNVAEATTSNVWFVARDILHTPDIESGILPGITRQVVIELAGAMGLPVRETTCRVSELRAADEAFLTNSVIELVPVRTVDGAPLGGECPGPITNRLMAAYTDRVIEECGL